MVIISTLIVGLLDKVSNTIAISTVVAVRSIFETATRVITEVMIEGITMARLPSLDKRSHQ